METTAPAPAGPATTNPGNAVTRRGEPEPREPRARRPQDMQAEDFFPSPHSRHSRVMSRPHRVSGFVVENGCFAFLRLPIRSAPWQNAAPS